MVFIIIAVQRGLESIKTALAGRGYEVVDLESYGYPIDAIIYRDNLCQLSFISRNNMPEMSSSERFNYGILLINSSGRSMEDIEEILKRRCYSPIF